MLALKSAKAAQKICETHALPLLTRAFFFGAGDVLDADLAAMLSRFATGSFAFSLIVMSTACNAATFPATVEPCLSCIASDPSGTTRLHCFHNSSSFGNWFLFQMQRVFVLAGFKNNLCAPTPKGCTRNKLPPPF